MKNIRIEIKWALIFVIMMLIWVFMEKSLGWHDEKIAVHGKFTMLVAVPAVAIYIFGLLDKKRNFYQGRMNYQQGFKAGLIMTVIIALFSPLMQYIINVFITPDFFNNVINYSVSQGLMTQEDAEANFNLKSYMIQSPVGALIMGIGTSAVVAVLVKSKT